MLVWMENPKHGRMPCYSPQEVEANKKNGWFECGPPPWVKNEPVPPSSPNSVATATESVTTTGEENPKTDGEDAAKKSAIKAYAAKFGEPPDGRWSLKKILQALEE